MSRSYKKDWHARQCVAGLEDKQREFIRNCNRVLVDACFYGRVQENDKKYFERKIHHAQTLRQSNAYGTSRFKNLTKTRPERRRNKAELVKYMKYDDYEPMSNKNLVGKEYWD